MPKKQKRSRKVSKIVEKPLCLSDLYLFRSTYLDESLIDKLLKLTDDVINTPKIAQNDETKIAIDKIKIRLNNYGFNNIYDYLETLVEIADKDKTNTEEIHKIIEENFPEPESLKLINMYTCTDMYDV